MKLIIDIHKKDYQSILNSGQVPYGVVCAIMNGTPLPKGHGRLIDADKLNIYDVSPADGFVVMGVTEEDIDLAPTIIEADKEG